MSGLIARSLMRLAVHLLDEGGHGWARAMVGEYGAALADGKALSFAAGCLVAAVRERASSNYGQASGAAYLFALGVLIPGAAYQLLCIIGYPLLPLGGAALFASLAPGSNQDLYFGEACRGAAPALIALRLLLAAGHLRLAWVLVERNWTGVVSAGALLLAASLTMAMLTSVLLLHDPAFTQQAGLLAAELGAVALLARWSIRAGSSHRHDRLA